MEYAEILIDEFFSHGDLFSALTFWMPVTLCAWVVARAIVGPIRVRCRGACPVCRYPYSVGPEQDRCVECGAQVERVGVVTRALAARYHSGTLLAVVAWLSLCLIFGQRAPLPSESINRLALAGLLETQRSVACSVENAEGVVVLITANSSGVAGGLMYPTTGSVTITEDGSTEPGAPGSEIIHLRVQALTTGYVAGASWSRYMGHRHAHRVVEPMYEAESVSGSMGPAPLSLGEAAPPDARSLAVELLGESVCAALPELCAAGPELTEDEVAAVFSSGNESVSWVRSPVRVENRRVAPAHAANTIYSAMAFVLSGLWVLVGVLVILRRRRAMLRPLRRSIVNK